MAKKSTTSSAPKALQGVRNADIYGSGARNPNTPMAIDELRQTLNATASSDYRARTGNIGQQYASDPSISNIQRRATNDPLNAQGESMFDENVMFNASDTSIQNTRAENEPWYAKVGAGVAKGLILAATTFADGTAGLIMGLGQMIVNAAEGQREGETGSEYANRIFSGLYDNPISQALKQVNDFSEKILPNYYSTYEEEAPWYANILSANFIGDKFLKNLGFTVGAFYSGKLWTAPLKYAATGIQKLATASKVMKKGRSFKDAMALTERALTQYGAAPNGVIASHTGSFVSALNEGRIEALNNSTDWLEKNKRALDSEYQTRIQSIKEQYGEDSEQGKYLLKKEEDAYNQTMAALATDAARVGNVDLLLNIPILHASNMIQFGKLYAKGFKDNARALTVSRLADGTYDRMGKRGMIKAALKPILSEGSEEALQQAASDAPSDYYAKDIQNFYKYKTNRKAEVEELNMIQSTASTLLDTFTRGDTWEQFFIGGLTGAMGMPMFRSTKGADGKWRSPITIEGGSRQEVKDYIAKMNKYNQLSDYMNNRMQDPKFQNYLRGLIRNRAYQNAMQVNLEEGDEKSYKDNEFGQLVSDIMMFDQAGRLDDYKEILRKANDLGTDEDIQKLIDDTSSVVPTVAEQSQIADLESQIKAKETLLQDKNNPPAPDQVSAINAEIESMNQQIESIKENSQGKHRGPYVDENGNRMAPLAVKEDLARRTAEIEKAMDSYIKTRDSITQRFPSLSDDAISHLVYLQEQINNWDKRGAQLGSEIQEHLPQFYKDLVDSLTDKTDEKSQKVLERVNQLKDMDGYDFMRELRRHPDLAIFLEEQINKSDLDSFNGALSLNTGEFHTLTKAELINKLADTVNIIASRIAFNRALQHYFEHPEAIEQDHQQIDSEEAEQQRQEAARNLSDSLKGKSASEVNKAINEGQITEEQVQEALEGASADDELQHGSLEALLIRKELKKKKKKLKDAADKGEITSEAAKHATEMLDKAAISAEEVAELNNLDSEAFNDLDDETIDRSQIDEVIDNAKNALSYINGIEEEEAKEAAELGGLLDKENPTPEELTNTTRVSFEDPGDTQSPDPTSRVKPVNNQETKEETQEETQEEGEEENPKNPEGADHSTPVESTQVETQIQQDAEKDRGPKESEESQENPEPELGDVYDYWNPTTTKYPIHRQRGDDRAYWEISQRDVHRALYEFLLLHHVFERQRQVQKGDIIRFGFHRMLNNNMGFPVLLMFDKDGNIVGDLPWESNLVAKRKGLKALYEKGEELLKENSEGPIIMIPGIESVVTHKLVGKPQYTRQEDRNFLNDIAATTDSQGNTQPGVPVIGIAVRDEGSTNLRMVVSGKKKSERTKEDRRSMVAPSAVPGQPFLMIETSNPAKQYYPVPIIMPKAGEIGEHTVMGKLLSQILSPETISKLDETTVLGWKDDLHSLLQFYDIRVDFDEHGKFDATKPVRVKLKATDKYYTKVALNDLRAAFKDAAIKVDLTSLNDSDFMETGVNYNEIIGDIATTNLPVKGNQTINDWFAIAPVVEGKPEVDDKGRGVTKGPKPIIITGRASQEMFEFTDKKGENWAFNTRTNDIYHKGVKLDISDPKIQLLAARAYLMANDLMDNTVRDTPFGKYDPIKNCFVRETAPTTISDDPELATGSLEEILARKKKKKAQQQQQTQETQEPQQPTTDDTQAGQQGPQEQTPNQQPLLPPSSLQQPQGTETETGSEIKASLTEEERKAMQKTLNKLMAGNLKWKSIVSKMNDTDIQLLHALATKSSVKAKNIVNKLLATNGKLSVASIIKNTDLKPVTKPEGTTHTKQEDKKLLPGVPARASEDSEVAKKLREALKEANISEEQYDKMSIEEKNQFAKCRGLI